MIPVVYIAGPFRGPHAWAIEENIRHAERLALEVWRLGAAAICPHTNTRFFHGAAPDDIWLKGDIAILLKCDAVLMTDNWQQSTGASDEHRIALAHNLIVCYTLDELRVWLHRQS